MSTESGESLKSSEISDDAIEHILNVQDARQTAIVLIYLMQYLVEASDEDPALFKEDNCHWLFHVVSDVLSNASFAVSRKIMLQGHGLFGQPLNGTDANIQATIAFLTDNDLATPIALTNYNDAWERIKAEIKLLDAPESAVRGR